MESYIHEKNEGLDSSQVNMIRVTAERSDFIYFLYYMYQPVMWDLKNRGFKGHLKVSHHVFPTNNAFHY